MTTGRYLDRIGVDPSTFGSADLNALERIQRAHVTAVPFENLAIVGDPFDDSEGPGVSLSLTALYEKIVVQGRGGYCFELNGLFCWLLDELGYDVDRVAARITSGDGVTLPANHHSSVVHLDRRYVVDVGMGTPKLRRPIPIDGAGRTDGVGIEWRVVGSDRQDADYRMEFRREAGDDWTRRYVFTEVPRDIEYFEATNDYLQSAPESTFTGSPTVSIGTTEGYRKLDSATLVERRSGREHERTVPERQWYETLAREFDLHCEFD